PPSWRATSPSRWSVPACALAWPPLSPLGRLSRHLWCSRIRSKPLPSCGNTYQPDKRPQPVATVVIDHLRGRGPPGKGAPTPASHRHLDLLAAGTLLPADGPGPAAPFPGARGGLLPGRRPGAADPGGGSRVPPDRPGRLPPRLDPRTGRGTRAAPRPRRGALPAA